MKKLSITTAFALIALASPAYSFTLLNYTLDDNPGAFYAGYVNGYGYYDGPIGFHTDTAGDFEVYCADLNHYLQTGKTYHFGLLKTDGNGNNLSELQSYEIGKIAKAGFANLGNQDFAAAAQLAIWAIEYNTSAGSFKDGGISADYTTLFSEFAVPGKDFNWATVVQPDSPWPGGGEWGSSQQMVIGLATGVPELPTWAYALMGFSLLGAVGFRQRKAARYAI